MIRTDRIPPHTLRALPLVLPRLWPLRRVVSGTRRSGDAALDTSPVQDVLFKGDLSWLFGDGFERGDLSAGSAMP